MSLSDYMHGSVEDEKKVAASAISNTINFLQNKLNNPLSVRQRDNYKTALKILGNPDNLHLVAKKIEGGSPAPQAIYNVYSTTAMAPKIMEGLIRYICDNRIGCRNYFEHVNNKGMMPGIINGMQLNTVNNYFEEKFHGARGHGFAAERANDLYDRLTGKDARIVGDDNAKDGADRIVNGVNIQSKYCSSGSRCVRECFRGDQFRYYNADGSPMQIEVPADKYDDAVRAMQDRIDKGQVRGAKRAEDIIRKGNVTYEQAKNITKFGTVESLKYDAANGVITGAYAGGISTAITFAVSRWQGKSFDEALQNSVRAGLQVGGISFAGAVVAGQLSKAGLNSALVNSSEALVSMMGPRASAQLVNAFRSGTNIYGAAAMKSASKLLRSNAITGAATVLVMSFAAEFRALNCSRTSSTRRRRWRAASEVGARARRRAQRSGRQFVPVSGRRLAAQSAERRERSRAVRRRAQCRKR